MPETDWRKVVAKPRDLAAQPTAEQLRLGRTLDLPINEETPRPVAAALLRRHLREALELPVPDPLKNTRNRQFGVVLNLEDRLRRGLKGPPTRAAAEGQEPRREGEAT